MFFRMITEEKLISDILTKTEVKIYNYIKAETGEVGKKLKESRLSIAQQLDTSDVSVHRTLKKLKEYNVISIIPSSDKVEPDQIVYEGFSDEKNEQEQLDDIFSMVNQLNSHVTRFENLLDTKQKTIDKLEIQLSRKLKEVDELTKNIDHLNQQIATLQLQKNGLDPERIISSQSLGDGTTAYIIKDL